MIKDWKKKPKNATDVDEVTARFFFYFFLFVLFVFVHHRSERSTRLRNSCLRNRCDFYTVHAITIILPYAARSRAYAEATSGWTRSISRMGIYVEKYVAPGTRTSICGADFGGDLTRKTSARFLLRGNSENRESLFFFRNFELD